jgi:integrase
MLIAAVETYLAVRRAAGFRLQAAESYLRSFARFATARGQTHVVTRTVIDWATIAAPEAQRYNRLMAVLRFARFVHAEDPRHELPPERLFCGRRQRPTPYIFGADEIRHLIACARRLGPPGSLRPWTYSTLFGLLAATGMRPAEAQALELRDLTPDGLVIRESKFKKSRLLPLHDTTRAALEQYLRRRRRVAGDGPHLFVSRRGGKLSHTVVAETFHDVVKAAGIPCEPGRPRPRLMDLRHNADSRIMPTRVRRVMQAPANRAVSSLPDAA